MNAATAKINNFFKGRSKDWWMGVGLGGACFLIIAMCMVADAVAASSRRSCHERCNAGKALVYSKYSTDEDKSVSAAGELPLDCSLFQAIYLPWTDVPTVWKPKQYQPDVTNFLFRMCWNITTTNCWEHRWDFAPPETFDTVVRIMTSLGRMYAYFLHSSTLGLSLLAFTGTAFTDDWARNLVYVQVPPVTLSNVSLGTRCHAGFYSIYAQVQAEIRQLVDCYRSCTDRFVITGYSLGSALATVAAFDLAKENPLVYAIGGPRVFNPVGAKQLNNMVPDNWRIFNTEDLVTDLPFSVSGENVFKNPLAASDIIYEHVGKPIAWTDSRGSFLDNHSRAYELWILAESKPVTCE